MATLKQRIENMEQTAPGRLHPLPSEIWLVAGGHGRDEEPQPPPVLLWTKARRPTDDGRA